MRLNWWTWGADLSLCAFARKQKKFEGVIA